MVMQIAQLSMGMQTMEAFTDMMANMPSPDGKGQLLNVLV